MVWPFFATVTVTAYIFTFATLVLGAWCRLNFDKGLAHYLQVSDALEGMDFTPVYFSKDAEKASSSFPVRFDGGSDDEKYPSDIFYQNTIQQPQLSYQSIGKSRGGSVYTNSSGDPVKLSSTPSLFQDNRSRKSAISVATSRHSFGGDHLDTEALDAYSQLPLPPKSVSVQQRTRSRDLTPISGRITPPSASESPFGSPTVSRVPSKKGLPSNPKTQNWI